MLNRPAIRRFGGWLAKITALIVLISLMVAWAIDYAGRKWGLPDAELGIILERPQVIVRQGTNGSWERQCTCQLPLASADIPAHLRAAVVSIEDHRFSVHDGVDWLGLVRATLANFGAGRVMQGGSTLSQQLAKTLVGDERTVGRKLREIVLAKRIESQFSKREILDFYLNRVYFGRNAWGIENAARVHFGKHAKDVSVNEAAMLAGMLQAPARLDPEKHPDAARERARVVLARMVENGHLTSQQERQALASGIRRGRIRPAEMDIGHYLDWLVRVLKQQTQMPLESSAKEWRVSVSLDPWAQLAASQAVRASRDSALTRHATEAAFVAMDTDGRVLALIGGRDFRTSQFDRVTQSRRQPGSTFKPFVYAAALEHGYTPDNRVKDRPITVDGWSPGNYDNRFLGVMTLEQAMAQSRNAATVDLARVVGFERVAALATRFGLPISRHPAFVLGAEAVRPIDLVTAYATLAAKGRRVTPQSPMAVVLDGYGRVVFQEARRGSEPVLGKKTAAHIDEMLRVAARSSLGRDGKGYAGKSGTTQDHRDAWFAGYSGSVAAIVWLGNDDDSPMRGVTGGTLPARVWRDFFDRSQGLSTHP